MKTDLSGHLDIFIIENEDKLESDIEKWQEVAIHGNPEGLRSFARLLLQLADLNQNNIANLPIGAREHLHLQPNFDLSKSSVQVIAGRLDAKGTGEFYKRYLPK